ncbi:uncharacterized protein [Oscarella lobularis]|uniref:uncharacterized protein isoform X2 n=1 Tax=Oscarella lobularis TaxID=121494 RepID=UPI0033144ED6
MVYGTKNKIGNIDEDRLFQVNKTFIVDGADDICNTKHLCTLSVSNDFETKSYDENISFLCPSPLPRPITESSPLFIGLFVGALVIAVISYLALRKLCKSNDSCICCNDCCNNSCNDCCNNCCNNSDEADRHKKATSCRETEEAESNAISAGATAAASSSKNDEVEPYSVPDTKEKKSKAAHRSVPKEEYAKPDMSKKLKKIEAQQAPTGGDVYAQVDKKKKAEKSVVTYTDLAQKKYRY